MFKVSKVAVVIPVSKSEVGEVERKNARAGNSKRLEFLLVGLTVLGFGCDNNVERDISISELKPYTFDVIGSWTIQT